MEHTGDRLKVIFRVSPPGEIWFAFHSGGNTSYNPIFFSHRVKFRPEVNFTPLAVTGS